MKRSLFLLACLTLPVLTGFAQCSSCATDTTCVSAPAYPTLCPAIMPDATAGLYYEEDLTFWLPANFDDPDTGVNVDLEQMTITNVQGIPFGLAYTADIPNGIYHPQQNEFGCVRICGTPLAPGSYSVTISFLVDVVFSGITITLPQQFVLPLTVLPGTGGNTGFSFTPTSGCDDVCATFTALIDGTPLPTSHTWTFGTDSITGPTAYRCFTDSGAHVVSLRTDIHEYVITDLYIDGVNDNWCGDVEEPYIFGCTLAPDLFFVVTDGNGNDIFTSSTGSDSETEEWHNLSIALNDPPYSIQFWDEDLFSGNDPLGTYNLTLTSAGTYAYNVAGGTNGSVIIGTQLFQSFTYQDTVLVFTTPPNTLLHDSLAGTLSLPILDGQFTWFLDGDTIPFQTDSVIALNDPGLYWVNASTPFGCTLVSDTFLLCPTVTLTADTSIGLLSVSGNHSGYQWFVNGNPIIGADDPFLLVTAPGTYWVVVTTANGCMVQSDSFLDATAIPEVEGTVGELHVFPNPGNGRITITLPYTRIGAGRLLVHDASGKLLFDQVITLRQESTAVDLGALVPGMHLLTLEIGAERYFTRFLRQ